MGILSEIVPTTNARALFQKKKLAAEAKLDVMGRRPGGPLGYPHGHCTPPPEDPGPPSAAVRCHKTIGPRGLPTALTRRRPTRLGSSRPSAPRRSGGSGRGVKATQRGPN